ncbi:ABC transporter permease [soil metagenome]
MNKILLIARREFLTRVQKKTFLLTTILLPLIIFGFYAMIIYFSVNGSSAIKIAVADNANIFKDSIQNTDEVSFAFVKENSAEALKEGVQNGRYDGYIFIPSAALGNSLDSVQVVSAKSIGLLSRDKVQDVINNKLEEGRLLNFLSKAQLDSTHRKSDVKFTTLEGSEDSDAKAGISYAVGMISGFLIYIILFIYGTMVMRGVMEEKVSRIAEVIISSVKPFQLMMGKIFGIGAVGLVQFIIWIILVSTTRFLLFSIMPQVSAPQSAMSGLSDVLAQINFPLIIGCFIFYFLGGYFLYASLFAAVGSAVNEDPQDAQSLTLPIIMPIIFAIVIMMKAVNDPTSGLAIFGSLFPLTSPIVMMARIAHGVPDTVPYWQLITSMLLLIAGFIGTTWVAAKIYRTGILLYGKKITVKEMWKWAFKKN